MKLAYFQKRSRLKRYGFSLVITALVLPLFFFIPKIYFDLINSQTVSFLLFLLVVAASAWYGGLGPGILATVIASFVNYFTILKEDFPSHSTSGDLTISFIYLTLGFFISVISEARYEAEFQKDQFIALAAHEIKNPLTTIKGYAYLLKKGAKKGRKKLFGFVDEIDEQANRLLELINDLLDISKIEIGNLTYKDELFDFDSLIKKIVKNQQIVNNKKEIKITGYTEKIINADRYRIGQVVTNLLTNAIKYSPEQSPVKVRIEKKKGGVGLAIKDYGIGIPKAEQKAIFKHYYRSKRTRDGKTEGLGIGLFISSQIVKHYHGKLYVYSNGGKGSTFYLEIPRNY